MVSETNDYQIGGSHYKAEYQHWDFVTDTNMPYLLGCATKYISRWRKKKGEEDLRKAIHYIAKAEETNTYLEKELNWFQKLFGSKQYKTNTISLLKFTKDMEIDDAIVIHHIFLGEYRIAKNCIHSLMQQYLGEEPEPHYIDPDNNYFRG